MLFAKVVKEKQGINKFNVCFFLRSDHKMSSLFGMMFMNSQLSNPRYSKNKCRLEIICYFYLIYYCCPPVFQQLNLIVRLMQIKIKPKVHYTLFIFFPYKKENSVTFVNLVKNGIHSVDILPLNCSERQIR